MAPLLASQSGSLSQHRKLIAKLSLDADDAPRAYRAKALAVAASCMAYVVGLCGISAVGVLIGFTMHANDAGLLGAVVIFSSLALGWLVVSSFWVRLPYPDGHQIDPDSALKLWRLLGKLKHKLKAPAIHEIVIDEEFRVTIQQFPRWGFVGPQHNVLVVGLPWLQALSPKQASAGIAQEYARLGIRDGAVNAWFSRTRAFWPRLVVELPDETGKLRRAITAFVVKRVPYMQAYTLCLARQLALTADARAAACIGTERTAQALVRTNVVGRWMEEHFWPELFKLADEEAMPRKMPHRNMASAFRAADRSVSMRRIFKEELARKHLPEHEQASLIDRLAALNQKPTYVGMPEQTAAEYLLGTDCSTIIAALDASWLERVADTWKKRHEAVQGARLWLANFAEPENVESLSIETLTYYAQALLTVGERARAIPLLRRAAEHPQAGPDVAWTTAQALLEQDELEALQYLDLVMSRDAMHLYDATELALDISERHGKRDRISRYKRRLGNRLAA